MEIRRRTRNLALRVRAFILESDIALISRLSDHAEQPIPVSGLRFSVLSGDLRLQMDTGGIRKHRLELRVSVNLQISRIRVDACPWRRRLLDDLDGRPGRRRKTAVVFDTQGDPFGAGVFRSSLQHL